jgi:hypothetical protein
MVEGHVMVSLHPGFPRGELPPGSRLGAGGESAALDDVRILGLLLDDVAVEVEVRTGAPVGVEEPTGLGFQIRFHPGGDDLLIPLLVDDVPLGDDPHFLVPELDSVRGEVHVLRAKIHVTLGLHVAFRDLLLVIRFQRGFLSFLSRALGEGRSSGEDEEERKS